MFKAIVNSYESADNQLTAREANGIGTAIKVAKIHLDDVDVCKCCCELFRTFSRFNISAQKEICEKGGVELIFSITVKHNNDKELVKLCNKIVNYIVPQDN